MIRDALLASERPLYLSRFLFWVCLGFFIVGLGSGTIGDLIDGKFLVIASDFFSLTVFILCLFLVKFNILQPGMGLAISATEGLRNFYMSLLFIGIDNPSYIYAHDDIMKMLLITCLFATVLGLAVNKYIAITYNVIGIAMQFVYVNVFKDDKYFAEQFAVNCVIMSGNLSVVFYYRRMLEHLFVDLSSSLAATRSYQRQVEQLNEQNRPFVVFGRNTAGLVHDFRNDINGIDLTIQTMNLRHSRGKQPNSEDLDAIERSIANLNRRIDKVKFLTSATPDSEKEELNLERVVESALYPFTISPELRRCFDFQTVVIGDVYIYGYRLQYLQIIENIVRNSCEAIVSEHGGTSVDHMDEFTGPDEAWGKVKIELRGLESEIVFVFSDNGPGISFCKSAIEHLDCMNCSCFAIGRSTKSYGSGYGMVNIIQSVRELAGTLSIKTGSDGTSITIKIPRPRED